MKIREAIKYYNNSDMKYTHFLYKVYLFYSLLFPKLYNWEKKINDKRRIKDSIKSGIKMSNDNLLPGKPL